MSAVAIVSIMEANMIDNQTRTLVAARRSEGTGEAARMASAIAAMAAVIAVAVALKWMVWGGDFIF